MARRLENERDRGSMSDGAVHQNTIRHFSPCAARIGGTGKGQPEPAVGQERVAQVAPFSPSAARIAQAIRSRPELTAFHRPVSQVGRRKSPPRCCDHAEACRCE